MEKYVKSRADSEEQFKSIYKNYLENIIEG